MLMSRAAWAALACAIVMTATVGADDPPPPPADNGDKCTQDNKGFVFTPCNGDGKMSAIQYWATTCNEKAEGAATIEPPKVVPCERDCPDGTFYSPRTGDCAHCPEGFISHAKGITISDFRSLPNEMVSYCSPKPCSPWQASESGSFIQSGNQSVGTRYAHYGSWVGGADESVSVTLSLIVHVIEATGAVTFKYRVESEQDFDGLELRLNGTNQPSKTNPNSPFILSGLHHNWHTFRVDLPHGTTEIQWVYGKDQNQASGGGKLAGLDRAFVREIEVTGTQRYASHCIPCPAGKFRPEGQDDCRFCEANMFSPAGADKCSQCGNSQWSPPGSEHCYDRKQCTEMDYVAIHEACDPSNMQRKETWKLSNQNCKEDDSTKPKEKYVPCAPCPPGQVRQENGECHPCPEGQHVGQDAKCAACPAGKAAIPRVVFTNFDTMAAGLDPKYFKSACHGECFNSVWEAVPIPDSTHKSSVVGLHSGHHHGAQFVTELIYEFFAVSDGYVEAEYMFFHLNTGSPMPLSDDYDGIVDINGLEIKLLPAHDTIDNKGIVKHNIRKGNNMLKFVYSQTNSHNAQDPISLVLLNLDVFGDSKGGAPGCVPCMKGHYCPAGTNTFVSCPPGQYQDETGKIACVACEGERVAKDPGSSHCQICGPGTVPNKQKNGCDSTCVIEVDNHKYDLTSLKGKTFGPIYKGGQETEGLDQASADYQNLQRFFINVCGHVTDGNVCGNKQGEAVERSFSCQRINANLSYASGDWMDISPSRGGLNVMISGGDRCHQNDRERATNVSMRCDPEGENQITYVNEEPHCQYNFAMQTPLACPVCTELSYGKTEGECKDGIQNQTWFKVAGEEHCQGGFPKPADSVVKCRNCQADYYELTWGNCEFNMQKAIYIVKDEFKGCVDDGTTAPAIDPLKSTRRCIDAHIGKNTFTASIVVIIILLLLLLVSLCVLYRKHKVLNTRYNLLASQAGEMEEFEEGNQPSHPVEDN